jgi:hypothetical protein
MKKYLYVLSGVVVAIFASTGINATTVPTDMYVEPGAHSCLVTWNDEDNSAWNLRYRLFTDGPEEPVQLAAINGTSYNSQGYQAVTLTSPWSGNNVYGGYGAIYFRNATHQSATTDGYIRFTIPANYQNGTFTVNITTASTQYGSGRFVVGSTQIAAVEYNMSTGETHSWTVTGSTGDVITITSPEDQYSPDIALVAVYFVPAKEWTYVNNLTKTEYTIEDLELATEYEVQVQAIGNNGTLSDWCRPDVFMTLDEDPFVPTVHIMGEIDDQAWSPSDGTKMQYDPENELYTATVHIEADRTFGLSTELDDNGDMGGWNYILPFRFGPENIGDEELRLTDELIGKPLALSWDNFSDVRALRTGDYEITLSLEQNYVIIGMLEPAYQLGDVNKDGKVSIADVTTLINVLLSGNVTVETDNYSPAAANVNGDDKISIADVTALINLLLSTGA